MANIYLNQYPRIALQTIMQMKKIKAMSYNAGYDMDLKGYDKETGTIIKTDEEMIT